MSNEEAIDRSPSSLEAEKAVLGALILDAAEALPRVLETRLAPEDFSKEAHGEIYRALTFLYDKGEPVDLITVAEALNRRALLEKVGGASYLSELSDSLGVAANAARYARIVIDRSILRQMISISARISEECQGHPKDVDDVLDRAESAIFKVRDARGAQSLKRVPDLLTAAFKRINDLRERGEGLTGLPTGYEELDKLTGGFQRSDLIVLAARPGMGKTALALNLALNAALPQQRQQHRNQPAAAVAVFSLEMATEQLLQRLMCQVGLLNLGDLRTGRFTSDDNTRLTTAISRLENAEIHIDDTPAIRVLELRAKTRRLKSQLDSRGLDLGLVVVDYLQLMRGNERTDSREQEISEISRALKGLAKELNVPVLALSQLNRRLEDRPDKRPQLADLRESGAIEQDADLIFFVYRQEMYRKKIEGELETEEDRKLRGQAELIIGKHRNGPTGVVPLRFLAQYSSFVPPDPGY
ncbi:MAG: replicative DNA helicase [Candidatus Adiutrix sp.]|jgi:replicative DNA helicase|nr:replicative DNA helicase [Candidatus Adiutrix sp.]